MLPNGNVCRHLSASTIDAIVLPLLLELPVVKIAECGELDVNMADDMGLHMDGDECGLFEMKCADDSEVQMDVDECALFEVEVADDRGLHMDGDEWII
jgi:hypothetical protein